MHPDPERLYRVPLFAELSDADRARLASWFEIDEFEPGWALVHEGASDYAFLVLDEGTARVEHGGRVLAELGPGDVFGEMAFFSDGRRNANVISETEVRVFRMFGAKFREMQLEMPEVSSRLQALVQERMKAFEA
jgi:CRP-like cAMP-binding protein